jgi:hypothetical protein
MEGTELGRPRSGFARDDLPTPEPPRQWPKDPSERAKALVAAGKIGGAEFGRLGGMPAQRRYKAQQAAHARVAEAAAEHAEELIRMLLRIIRSPHSAAKDKLDAYQKLMDAEQFIIRNTQAHDREMARMSEQQRTEYLQRKMLETLGFDPDQYDLSSIGEIIEGTAVEDAA